jgi:predicted PurR-regulated permease PerM
MAELISAVRRHRLSIFALVMIVIVTWMLWSARGALPAFFIGVALGFILDPGVTRLQRVGVPRWAGVLAMYAAVVALVWLLLAFALPPIAEQSRQFLDHLPELGASIGNLERAVEDWYRSIPLPPELRDMVDASIVRGQEALASVVQAIIGPTINTLLRTATFVLGLIVIPVWLFFVLKDREAFPRAVAGALPPNWRPDGENLLAILARVGGRWVRGQLLLGASIFVATAIGLGILTLIGFGAFGQFLLVLALIAGVLEWFPIIGPIIAAIPALLVALTISPAAVIAILIVYTGIQQLENNILVPKVMGDAVELHPAVMILALVVGGALFGIGGAILAAPTVAAGRDLYRYGFHRFGGQPPAEAFELAKHGARRHRVEEQPPPAAPPPEAEASLA